MGTYYIPRNYKGESRILYIFTTKALILTAAFGLVGLVFYLIFASLGFGIIGIIIAGIFAVARIYSWNI